tara:strand:+ start:1066 stop:1761 length:696 start_codon:yes stop_codon:yes gene_type:complete
MSLREQEERDVREAVRRSLAQVQTEGYSFLPTFAERLPKAKICVIGANYGEVDNGRWSQIDPYYIGIEGFRYEPDLIPDNPIEEFNWNSKPGSISLLFMKGPLKGKKFESIIIDRGTFHHISNIMVLYSFFRVQQKFGPYADKFYLEEGVINKIPELEEKIRKLKQDMAYSGLRNGNLERLEDKLRATKTRMETVWEYLEPRVVDTIEVVGRGHDDYMESPTNRFYGYHFK